MSAGAVAVVRPGRPGALERVVRRNGWTMGLYLLLLAFLLFTKLIHASFGAFDIETLAIGALPLALAAAAQTAAVVAGGIDLSVGALMALANVVAASLMLNQSFGTALGIALLVLIIGTLAGALNGALVVATKVPDIVVTLAMSFVWGGVALLVLPHPGGGAPADFQALASGGFLTEWVPNALVLLALSVGLTWYPLQRTRLGLSLYAVGSDTLAAFRSGVDVARAKIVSYAVCGLFAAAGGLALTMTTGIGSPLAGTYYTLSGVAAVVLGGVSLAGGRGGMLGPLAAAYVLTIIPTDLLFLGADPNFGQVIQGAIMVLVVMAAGLISLRRSGA